MGGYIWCFAEVMTTILFHCITCIYYIWCILRYIQFTYSFKLVSIWYFLLRFLAFFLYTRLSFSSSSSVLGGGGGRKTDSREEREGEKEEGVYQRKGSNNGHVLYKPSLCAYIHHMKIRKRHPLIRQYIHAGFW